MKKLFIGALFIANIVTFVGCASTSSVPKLQAQQSLTQDGQVESRQGQFIVRITQMNTNSDQYKNIARHALPMRVTVLNASPKSIMFGPNSVQMMKGNKEVERLSAQDLSEIGDKKNRNQKLLAGFRGLMAVAGSVSAGLSGDQNLANQSLAYSENEFQNIQDYYSSETQKNNTTYATLGHQLATSVLPYKELKPKEAVDGLLFFKGVKASDTFRLDIKTGDQVHHIHYGK